MTKRMEPKRGSNPRGPLAIIELAQASFVKGSPAQLRTQLLYELILNGKFDEKKLTSDAQVLLDILRSQAKKPKIRA